MLPNSERKNEMPSIEVVSVRECAKSYRAVVAYEPSAALLRTLLGTEGNLANTEAGLARLAARAHKHVPECAAELELVQPVNNKRVRYYVESAETLFTPEQARAYVQEVLELRASDTDDLTAYRARQLRNHPFATTRVKQLAEAFLASN